jgi:ParB family transcriptional regulator, chromosome partitioning protein
MGRGLSAILPRAQAGGEGLREIPVDLVGPNPRQPRRSFDEGTLAELADSIRARGLLQPIVVRALAGGRYELLAGERRLRAARIAELKSIPALVREADERDQLDIALAENMARVDLNPVEEARACATLVDDLGLTKEEVGRRVGRSRVAISNLIRLLDLPEDALELIACGDLSEGHGRALLMCKDHAARRALARDARDGAWSVRETERRARELRGGRPDAGGPGPPRPKAVIHPDLQEALAAAEDALSAALGREVTMRAQGGRCRAELEFETPADAIQLAERIIGKSGSKAPLQSPRRAISSVG